MKTAVEWLIEQLHSGKELSNVILRAKEMEKEQIIDAFGVGCQVESTRLIGYQGMAEQYYKETFKQH